MLVRASAQDPLPEMRGRQVRWKCAHVQGRDAPCRELEGCFVLCMCAQGHGPPLLEMRGRQIRWKCAHLLGAKEREEMEG